MSCRYNYFNVFVCTYIRLRLFRMLFCYRMRTMVFSPGQLPIRFQSKRKLNRKKRKQIDLGKYVGI